MQRRKSDESSHELNSEETEQDKALDAIMKAISQVKKNGEEALRNNESPKPIKLDSSHFPDSSHLMALEAFDQMDLFEQFFFLNAVFNSLIEDVSSEELPDSPIVSKSGIFTPKAERKSTGSAKEMEYSPVIKR